MHTLIRLVTPKGDTRGWCGAGSVGFKDALLGNQHWLEGTQLVVISNTQWVGETMPCLTYGMRGMIALSIEVCPST